MADAPEGLRHRLIRALGGVPQPPTAEVASAPNAEPVVGLVISGGGARSSFEVGALRYLYDRERIEPSVITGTSAGSILAAVLAQSADHEGQRRALGELERIWLEMQQSSDMFTELAWFTRLREHMPTWRKVLALRQRNANRVSLRTSLTAVLQVPIQAVERFAAERQAEPSGNGDGGAGIAGSSTAAVAPHRRWGAAPERSVSWAPVNAIETMTTLWEAGRASTDLEAILRGAQEERSAYRPGPIVDRLLEPGVFSPERTATSGVTLRIAVVGLESGELHYVTETGQLHDRLDRPLENGVEVDLVQAIHASCAIPAVFPPVRLGEEHYVDGGVRENLPVEVAIEHLGVTRCYAVVASPRGVPRGGSFAHKDMLEIMMRTASGIMSDELQQDEVDRAVAAGALVIQPELDIHDLVTIDPGLVSIAMDYGFLRAGDVCTNASAEEQALTRDVINLRRLIWTMEDELFSPVDPGAPGAEPANATGDGALRLRSHEVSASASELADLKFRLRGLLAEMPAGRLPDHADNWWRTWERHPYEIAERPDWVTD